MHLSTLTAYVGMLYDVLRVKFVDILIRIIERVLYNTPVKPLDPDKMQTFYRLLYDMPGFRQHVVERETRMVHALAAEKDSEARAQMRGQRVENSLLFAKAHRAFQKHEALAKGDTPVPSRKR